MPLLFSNQNLCVNKEWKGFLFHCHTTLYIHAFWGLDDKFYKFEFTSFIELPNSHQRQTEGGKYGTSYPKKPSQEWFCFLYKVNHSIQVPDAVLVALHWLSTLHFLRSTQWQYVVWHPVKLYVRFWKYEHHTKGI